MTKTRSQLRSEANKDSYRVPWGLSGAFLALAVGLWFLPRRVDVPILPAVEVARETIAPGPARTPMTLPPTTLIEGRQENCNACHQLFESAHLSGERPAFHADIRLVHGRNNRCLNCHDAKDREHLALRDGMTVSFEESPELCAQCHGTLHRDWQRGTHGKTLGSWAIGSPSQRRLRCVECHDPHAPKYPPYTPLPAPRTLRMGEPTPQSEDESELNSLQRWLHQARKLGESGGQHD